MDRIKELETILRKASKAYYAGEACNLSDAEFDRLRDELEDLDPKNPFLAEVGSLGDSALQKVGHSIPMGSLKKITKLEEFTTWRNTVKKTVPGKEIAVQLKLDGLSISLAFKNGKFVQAVTRGDGEVGEDVTHTIRNAKGFPKTISEKADVFVRCEALLAIKTWKTHFSDKANPRNAASGLVRRTDGKGSEHLTCIAFDVLFDNQPFKTEKDRINWLTKQGFMATTCDVFEQSEVEDAVNAMGAKRASLPFEIDGAVIKLNSIAEQEKLGQHDGRPYWARAWKFPALGGHTILLDVEWAVGTQGTITPVAKVAPVSVGGTTIQNITLHNMDEIERLGIHIGDAIEVIRAGDVIPKIVRVVAPGKTRKTIKLTECPSCDSPVLRDGPRMVCSKKNKCFGVRFTRIQKWIDKRGIMHLGDSNLKVLVKMGVVRDIPDLYKMPVEDMVAAGLGQRMSEKIFEQIENSRNCSLTDLIGSLSIDMLGRSEAKNLESHGIDTFQKWNALDVKTIASFPGYQQTKATRIYEGLRANWDLIETLVKELTVRSSKPKTTGGKLSNKSFCFTGTMDRPRKELEDMVVDAGGEVRSVSKELTYLVIADPSSQSSKATKARDMGVKLISEQDFLKMVK